MKVIIAGSRSITDYREVVKAIELSGFTITEVVSGTAKGVDTLGERWAQEHNVPVKQFPPDWKKHGRRAGPLRNSEMASYANTNATGALIAIWDGKSHGTLDMINKAKAIGLQVFIHHVLPLDYTECML